MANSSQINAYKFTYAFETKSATAVEDYLTTNVDPVSQDNIIILCDNTNTNHDNTEYNYIIKVKDSNNKVSDWFWPTQRRTAHTVLDPNYHKNTEIKNAFNRNIYSTDQINNKLKELYNEHFDLVIPFTAEKLTTINHPAAATKTLSEVLSNIHNQPVSFNKRKFNKAYGQYSYCGQYSYNSYIGHWTDYSYNI